jgi:hypothetical protein
LEVRNYLKKDVPINFNISEFWKSTKTEFPRMFLLAQAVLGISASSADSERHFSISGLILNARRSNLQPEKVKKIMFIHENYFQEQG